MKKFWSFVVCFGLMLQLACFVPNEVYTATVAEGKITVNGKSIINAAEQYPLLVFRSVTYFPLTWRFSVEEFGWDYSYIDAKGLVINSK